MTKQQNLDRSSSNHHHDHHHHDNEPSSITTTDRQRRPTSSSPSFSRIILVIIYALATLLCLAMIAWILLFPSSFLVGYSSTYTSFLHSIVDDNVATWPTPKATTFKYERHHAVKFLHILPGAIWSLLVPFQLCRRFSKRLFGDEMHRRAGYALFAMSASMMVGVALIDRRGLLYFENDYPSLDAEDDYATSRSTGGGYDDGGTASSSVGRAAAAAADVIFDYFRFVDTRMGVRLVGAWFLSTMIVALQRAKVGDYDGHARFVIRHVASGLWVAVQRLYVMCVPWKSLKDQKINFGNGVIFGVLASVLMAEVAIICVDVESKRKTKTKVHVD